MRKYFYWMLTMTLLFASLGPSLSIVMAESLEENVAELISEGTPNLEVDESPSGSEAEERLEDGVPEVSSEPANSAEPDEQVDGAEEIISPEYLVLELIGAVDDNTLVIKGVAGPEVIVKLKNQSNHVLQSVIAESNGEFMFKLNEPFGAETGLKIETYKESELLSELNVTVEGRGLHYEAVSDKSTEVLGRTSPNKIVVLLNAEGAILDEVQSDADGNFQFNLIEPLVRDTMLFLQVKDDGRVAREEKLKVIESVSEVEESDDNQFFKTYALIPSLPSLTDLLGLSSVIVPDGIVVNNLPITDGTIAITGFVIAQESLIEVNIPVVESLLKPLVDLLLGELNDESITLSITNDGQEIYRESRALSGDSTHPFSFDISGVNLIPGSTELILSIEDYEAVIVGLLGIVRIEFNVDFKDKQLTVVGTKFSLTKVPDDIIFNTTTLEYASEKKITRQQEEPLTIEVLDTISLSKPDEQEWKVMVHATGPLTLYGSNGENHSLGGSLFFNNQLIEESKNAQLVGTNEEFTHTGNGVYSYTIPAEDDFYLQLNPALDAVAGSYTTTIQWDLVNGP